MFKRFLRRQHDPADPSDGTKEVNEMSVIATDAPTTSHVGDEELPWADAGGGIELKVKGLPRPNVVT